MTSVEAHDASGNTVPVRARRLFGFGEVIPPLSPRGRVLVCTSCGISVELFEAAQDAGPLNDPRHQRVDAETFRCGGCLEAGGDVAPIEEMVG